MQPGILIREPLAGGPTNAPLVGEGINDHADGRRGNGEWIGTGDELDKVGQSIPIGISGVPPNGVLHGGIIQFRGGKMLIAEIVPCEVGIGLDNRGTSADGVGGVFGDGIAFAAFRHGIGEVEAYLFAGGCVERERDIGSDRVTRIRTAADPIVEQDHAGAHPLAGRGERDGGLAVLFSESIGKITGGGLAGTGRGWVGDEGNA